MRSSLLAGVMSGCLLPFLSGCCCCAGPANAPAKPLARSRYAVVASGERNGAKYTIEMGEAEGVRLCDLVFSADPKDPAFVDKTLREALDKAIAQDASKDILAMAFVGDTTMKDFDGQYSGPLSFRASARAVEFLHKR